MTSGKKRGGFASMDPERRREIASLGGRAAHKKGVAYTFTSEAAREAGKKGKQSQADKKKPKMGKRISVASTDQGRG